MLVGMVAGGVLIVRSILVWGVGEDYAFGIDIPISAIVVLLWAISVTLLLRPPRAVLATRTGANPSVALVWPLGRRLRFWTVIATPVCGLLGAFVAPLLIQTVAIDLSDPVALWLGLPLSLGTLIAAIALIWAVMRGALHGVEITTSDLVARGYFFTRRYPRDSIIVVDAVKLRWWPSLLLSIVLNADVEHTVRLELADGSRQLILAANSSEHDVQIGVEMLRRWHLETAAPARR